MIKEALAKIALIPAGLVSSLSLGTDGKEGLVGSGGLQRGQLRASSSISVGSHSSDVQLGV